MWNDREKHARFNYGSFNGHRVSIIYYVTMVTNSINHFSCVKDALFKL